MAVPYKTAGRVNHHIMWIVTCPDGAEHDVGNDRKEAVDPTGLCGFKPYYVRPRSFPFI